MYYACHDSIISPREWNESSRYNLRAIPNTHHGGNVKKSLKKVPAIAEAKGLSPFWEIWHTLRRCLLTSSQVLFGFLSLPRVLLPALRVNVCSGLEKTLDRRKVACGQTLPGSRIQLWTEACEKTLDAAIACVSSEATVAPAGVCVSVVCSFF